MEQKFSATHGMYLDKDGDWTKSKEWLSVVENPPERFQWHLTSFMGCVPRVLFYDGDGIWPAIKDQGLAPTHHLPNAWPSLDKIK